jgi:PPE-repeat protein
MNENYLHYNGSIVNGNWDSILDPEFISPKINGKSLFEYTVSSLKEHINKLPSSDLVSPQEKMYVQIIANNGSSKYLFENGPQELTTENKINALSFLNNLRSEVESPINPWGDICEALESENTGQLIILSAWKPNNLIASRSQPCANFNKGNFEEIINEYNQFTRSESSMGALVIDSISIYHNFCESSKNIFNNQWLGTISGGAESFCIHIK